MIINQKASFPRSEKDLKKHYAVYYKNKLSLYLSPHLAIKNDLGIKDLKKIRRIHIKRLRLFDEIESESDVTKLHELANDLEKIEYELQKAWKLNLDSNFHSWWFRAPKCTCPKLDNKERIGTGLFIIDRKCLLHGELSV